MNSPWLLLIVQSVLILMGSSNAASTEQGRLEDSEWEEASEGSWEDYSKEQGNSEVTETPPFDLELYTEGTDYRASGELPSSPEHEDTTLTSVHERSYYPRNYPTDTVVQFAQLRNVIRRSLRAMQQRSNAIDKRINILIKETIPDINRDSENNNELIRVEAERRITALRHVHRFVQNQIRYVREELVVVNSNLRNMQNAGKANRASQVAALQSRVAVAYKQIQDIKEELNRHFEMIGKLQKLRNSVSENLY